MEDPQEPDHEALIHAAAAALAALDLEAAGPAHPQVSAALPPLLAGREAAFLAWARHHPRWSLAHAEVAAAGACAKPREAALLVLLEVLRDLRELGA